MLWFLLFFFFFFSGQSLAWCGTGSPSKSLVDFHKAMNVNSLQRREEVMEEEIKVKLYFWIIKKEDQPEDIVTQDKLHEQFDLLQSSFAPAKISFEWNPDDRHVVTNDTWADGFDNQSLSERMREGDSNALNVWIPSEAIEPTMPGVLGATALTEFLTSKGKILRWDKRPETHGVFITRDALPNSDGIFPRQGRVLVHEVGHWFGLLHTFEGLDCEGPGDFIDDTPQEGKIPHSPFDTCFEEGKEPNSCPEQHPNIPDPFYNWMDYSGEGCMREFTDGQMQRMREFWYAQQNLMEPDTNSETEPEADSRRSPRQHKTCASLV